MAGGIELDFGKPLAGATLDTLYVEPDADLAERFGEWLMQPDGRPLMVMGQIGCGKTTFIQKHLEKVGEGNGPDLTLLLDTELPDFSPAAVVGYLLVKLHELGCVFGAAFAECCAQTGSEREVLELLSPVFAEDRLRRQALLLCLSSQRDALWREIEAAIEVLERRQGRRLLVVVVGLDKLPEDRAEYLACEPLLNLLSSRKTLYEANLIHAISRGVSWKEAADQLILRPFPQLMIESLLRKRLGVYSNARVDALPAIARLSGGSPR